MTSRSPQPTAVLSRQKALGDPAARMALGRAARAEVPRGAHGDWDRHLPTADPIAILEAQAISRVPDLLPIRYGRMLSSPFAFYRGAAAVMAPTWPDHAASGLMVQACGDAHASEFRDLRHPGAGHGLRRQRLR